MLLITFVVGNLGKLGASWCCIQKPKESLCNGPRDVQSDRSRLYSKLKG